MPLNPAGCPHPYKQQVTSKSFGTGLCSFMKWLDEKEIFKEIPSSNNCSQSTESRELDFVPVLPEAGASKESFSKNPRKRSIREASVIYIYK